LAILTIRVYYFTRRENANTFLDREISANKIIERGLYLMKQKIVAYPNINAELARAGLSFAMIADFMGITRQAIYNKLGGKAGVTLKDMEQIQEFFKVKGCGTFTLDYLFKKNDE
jgi:predicted transcriptional regulator